MKGQVASIKQIIEGIKTIKSDHSVCFFDLKIEETIKCLQNFKDDKIISSYQNFDSVIGEYIKNKKLQNYEYLHSFQFEGSITGKSIHFIGYNKKVQLEGVHHWVDINMPNHQIWIPELTVLSPYENIWS